MVDIPSDQSPLLWRTTPDPTAPTRSLTDEGYFAWKRQTAPRRAARATPPPALVLLDLVLPEHRAWIANELKSAAPRRTCSHCLSGAKPNLLGRRAAELADAVVAKPFDIEELLAKISAARRRHVRGAMSEVHRLRGPVNTLCQRGGLQKRTISAPP